MLNFLWNEINRSSSFRGIEVLWQSTLHTAATVWGDSTPGHTAYIKTNRQSTAERTWNC